jgi:hypothetical protein
LQSCRFASVIGIKMKLQFKFKFNSKIRPQTPNTLFIKLQIDTRTIELLPQDYRPTRIEIDQSKYDFELCTIQRGSNNRRFQAETTRLLDEKYRLHVEACTDGSKKEEKVDYAGYVTLLAR